MKKQIQITGIPVGEIQIGSPTVIMESNRTRRTSTVIAIYAKSKTKLVFETKNTVYFLEYPIEFQRTRSEVMLGSMLKQIMSCFHSGGRT